MALITTIEQLEEVALHYSMVDAFAFDVETIGDDRSDPHIAKVAWLSLACGSRSDVIPMGHPNGELLSSGPALLLSGRRKLAAGKPREALRPSDFSKDKIDLEFGPPPEQLDRSQVFEALRPVFFGDALKIGHNVKFDLHAVKKYLGDEHPTGPYYDTLVASWLLDVTAKGSLGLADCYQRETGGILEKGVGKDISRHSFDEVTKYSLLDAEATWAVYQSLERRYGDGSASLRHLRDLEMLVLEPVVDMEAAGVRIDRDRLEEIDEEFRSDIDAARAMIYLYAGRKFNIRSNRDKQQILFAPRAEGGFGMKPLRVTDSASKKTGDELEITDYAVDQATLEHLRATSKGRAHQMVDSMIQHASKVKLHGTYVLPYLGGYMAESAVGADPKYVPSRLRNGRIYGQFVQHGTESGRFSCVAGETLLETSRGVFRFDEYIPEQGDLVLTHERRWMPVLRKIYKGTDMMYRVRAGGRSLLCTLDHRLWTPEGWKRVGDLVEGDAVVCLEELGRDLRTGGGEEVQGRRQADAGGTGRVAGDDVPERAGSGAGRSPRAGVPGGEGTPVLAVEDRGEPYAGQEWFPASRVQGVGAGRQGLPHRAEGRRSGVPAPAGTGSGAGSGGVAVLAPRSPSGRGQGEQCIGQPGPGDPGRAPVPAQVTARVDSISFVGAMGVWDIEVGGDHSYAAHGFLNHNSRNPNLQNIPSRSQDGRKLREIFVADPGHVLVVADYSQIEPRIIASLSGDKTMIAAYLAGEDVYQVVGDRMSVPRAAGKELVLSIAYGVGSATISQRIGCSVKEARELMDFFLRKFPAIPKHKTMVISKARRNRYSETIMGRRRPLPAITWTGNDEARSMAERQAYNHLIQGSAADIMKMALVNVHYALPPGASLLMTVHDEVVVQCPEHLEEEVRETVRYEMEGSSPSSLVVPMVAEVGSGRSWLEAK